MDIPSIIIKKKKKSMKLSLTFLSELGSWVVRMSLSVALCLRWTAATPDEDLGIQKQTLNERHLKGQNLISLLWYNITVQDDSSYHWWLTALSPPLRCPAIRATGGRGVLSLLGWRATGDIRKRDRSTTAFMSLNYIRQTNIFYILPVRIDEDFKAKSGSLQLF